MYSARCSSGLYDARQLIAWSVHWIALVAVSVLSAYNNWGAGRFSPDSWAYFELSNTIAQDFYKIEHFRSYWTSDYSAAFPPLWPSLIFLANKVFNIGPDAAIFLNILILFLMAIVADSISSATFNLRGPGPLLALASLTHPGFFSEIFAGRSIPLFVLLALIVFRIIVIKKTDYKILRFFALGAVLSAMFMTRFDGATWFFILSPLLIMLKPGVYGLIAFLSAFAAGVAPWVLYSMKHFGLILASDNSWVARSLNPSAFVTDYPAAQGPTIFEDLPFAIDIVLGRMPDLFYAIAASPSKFGFILIVVLFLILLSYKPWQNLVFLDLCKENAGFFAAIGIATISALPSYLLTGYYDGRYFSLYFLLVVFVLLISIWPIYQLRGIGSILALVCSVTFVSLALVSSSGRTSTTQIGLTVESELSNCLQLGPNHSPILISNAIQGARLTALYGVRTAFIPHNFGGQDVGPETRQTFLRSYDIEYIIGNSENIEGMFDGWIAPHRPDCGFNIYRVSL